MFNRITLRSKLIIPTIAITIILFLLGAILIYTKYNERQCLVHQNEKIIVSAKISELVHSIQKERGLSSGYAITYRGAFKKELYLQRDITDQKIKDFKIIIKNINDDEFKIIINDAFLKIDKINNIRELVNNHKINSIEIIKKYTQINNALNDVLIYIIKQSNIPKITQNLISYSYMITLKEFTGIERALGISLLSQLRDGQGMYFEYLKSKALEKENEKMFLKYASKNIKDYYNSKQKKSIDEDIEKIRDIIAKKIQKVKVVNPNHWFYVMTKKINTYQSTIKYIKDDTKKIIKDELFFTSTIYYAVIFLTIISLLTLLLMIIAFLRLAKDEQRLRMVMDKYIISSVTNTKGRITEVSEAFCKISGYKKHELIGKKHNIVRHPDMRAEVFKDLWDTISSGKSWSGKVKNLKKDGSAYWVYSNIEPLYDKNGNIDSYISIRLDITQSEELMEKIKEEEEKNRLTQQMMQQQSRLAQMGEMLSMIAHQWRQPLSAISASASGIYLKARRDRLKNETAIELANKIIEFSKHLSSTIDDFRDFFKTNKIKTKTDFNKILNSVLDIISVSLEQKSIKLNININSLQEFETFENEVKQVLLNLIKNAEDALVENQIENGQIDIHIDNNILTVSDNAGGIPEDIIDKIFDPYFSTKTQKDGTGLGLYMSKTIIQEHCNGNLTVKNDRNGAKFTITLGENNDS